MKQIEIEKLIPTGEVVSLAERIVILYADLSGRESANRGLFRQEVIKILNTFLTNYISKEEAKNIINDLVQLKLYKDYEKDFIATPYKLREKRQELYKKYNLNSNGQEKE